MHHSIGTSIGTPASSAYPAAPDSPAGTAPMSSGMTPLPMTYLPGAVIGTTGTYALLNSRGMDTIVRVGAFEGTALPPAPRGWAWRLEPMTPLPPC